MRKALVALVMAALLAGTVTLSPREAEAQTTNPVTASPQGLIGGALLGAELVVMIQGIARLRPRWAYIVFPLLGAVGGGVGGFFLDQAIDSAMPPSQTLAVVPTAMLVVGLGLIIPSVIVYANATAFRAEDAVQQNQQEADAAAQLEESSSEGSSSAPGSGSGSGSTSGSGSGSSSTGSGGGRRSRRPLMPEALLQFAPGQFRLGLPVPSLLRSFTMAEMQQYGLTQQQTEWRVPLISASF